LTNDFNPIPAKYSLIPPENQEEVQENPELEPCWDYLAKS